MQLEFRVIDGRLVAYNEPARLLVSNTENMGVLTLKHVNKAVGSLSMLRTWKMWMKEAAAHWHHRGITMPHYLDGEGKPHGTRPINADDCHQMYTMKFLGSNNEGKRLSWSMDGGDDGVTVATKEQRLFAMDRFVEMATEYAIPITIPRWGDYADYKEAQVQ